MLTLSKIAKLAHVSVSTASKAFSMSSEVSEKNRQEIFQVAKEYGCFKKFYNAKYPKFVVAIICPEFYGRYYSRMIALLEDRLRLRNCDICVAATGFSVEKEAELLDYYHNYANVDGIIIIGGNTLIPSTYELPVVSVIPDCRQIIGVSVNINRDGAIREIIRYFAEREITDIAFVGERYTHGKQTAFLCAMEENGLRCHKIAVSTSRFETGGYQGMEQLLSQGKPPRAVVCAYDYMAIGAMKCLADRGLRVPQDVAVVGMDNIPEAEFLVPCLSSVDFCIEQTCDAAANAVVDMLGGKEVEKNILFDATLRLRDSSEI